MKIQQDLAHIVPFAQRYRFERFFVTRAELGKHMLRVALVFVQLKEPARIVEYILGIFCVDGV